MSILFRGYRNKEFIKPELLRPPNNTKYSVSFKTTEVEAHDLASYKLSPLTSILDHEKPSKFNKKASEYVPKAKIFLSSLRCMA